MLRLYLLSFCFMFFPIFSNHEMGLYRWNTAEHYLDHRFMFGQMCVVFWVAIKNVKSQIGIPNIQSIFLKYTFRIHVVVHYFSWKISKF